MAEAREKAAAQPRRFSVRNLVRAFHRDLGNLAVGLTLVYAASGLAVNHIADWDPNFQNYAQTHELGGRVEGDDEAAAKAVMTKLGLNEEPKEVYRSTPEELEVVLEDRTLHVNTTTGRVFDEGQKPRFLLRVANWLHLNRGKKAWTYVADGYAAALILLAFTGIFMLPGRRGLIGRGGIFVLIGVAIPIAYVQLAGGP
jgi:uncharacterized protein